MPVSLHSAGEFGGCVRKAYGSPPGTLQLSKPVVKMALFSCFHARGCTPAHDLLSLKLTKTALFGLLPLNPFSYLEKIAEDAGGRDTRACSRPLDHQGMFVIALRFKHQDIIGPSQPSDRTILRNLF
jgi:hypothetical protein